MRAYLVVLLIVLCSTQALAIDLLGISQLGYSPDSQVKIIVYNPSVTHVNITNGTTTTTHALQAAVDYDGNPVSCHGGITCLVLDLTLAEGTYNVTAGNSTGNLTVHEDIYANSLPIYLEFFNAHMMQNSAYHAEYFGHEQPKYRLMPDGAFVLEAFQVSVPLIRLSNAYRQNPTQLQHDVYDVTIPGTPDIREYILEHIAYLRDLQVYNNRADDYMVAKGYTPPWGPWFNKHPDIPQYTTVHATFLPYSTSIDPTNTAQATLGFMLAVPIVAEQNLTEAEELLTHTLETMEYLYDNYDTTIPEVAAYLGAAYFEAYKLTGNWMYIETAYSLRDDVSQNLVSDLTRGNEFYWLAYVEHEQEIIDLGFEYPFGNFDPIEIFRGKMFGDYKDRGIFSMSANAERVYDFDTNIQFSNSRYMLLQAIFAAKTVQQYPNPEPFIQEIADLQLAWLTGMNAVQHQQSGNQLRSIPFISGIGREITQIHSRIMPLKVVDGTWTFSNGKSHIPGWITGAYDLSWDADVIRNYRESRSAYWHMETTNEMVALALELSALQDKHYNDRPSMVIPIIINESSPWPNRTIFTPPNTTNTTNTTATCSASLASAVASCLGGTVTTDIPGGCRSVVCTSASGELQVLACDKGTHFEMYKQTQTDPALEICLDATCIQNNGFAKSNDYASCGQPVQNGTLLIQLDITNDDGGNLTNVSITLEGNPAILDHIYDLEPGIYTVDAPDIAGYTKTYIGCADGLADVQEASSTVCTIAYDDVGTSSCVSDMMLLPASCSATLTQDSFTGCRSLACGDATDFITVLACDKGSHFEMYKQTSGGSTPQVCLGTVCMQHEGFVKSPDYPICGSGPACTDIDDDGYALQGGVCGPLDCNDNNATISPGAVEVCNQIDDNCDGQIDEGNVCPDPVCGNNITEIGETCDDGNVLDGDGCSASCQIEINASVTLSVAPWFPQGNSFVFICEPAGLNPTRYDFTFGDGNQNNYRTTKDVYYTYAGPGTYDVSCVAYEGSVIVNDTITVTLA